MASSDLVETETPVFTEEDVYMIGGFIAERFGVDVNDDTDTVVEVIEDAIEVVLSRGR